MPWRIPLLCVFLASACEGEIAGPSSDPGVGLDGVRGGRTTCGNHKCDRGETCSSCPLDCGVCPAQCGNGVIDPGETCDPPSSCPTSCDDGNACTTDTLTGSAASCNVACSHAAITACGGGDGCCPAGCTTATDSDCSPRCGNGVIDPGETCDPPSSCPTSCDDGNACTTDMLTGSAASCNAACSHGPITACRGGDGCCPAGCTSATDSDCAGGSVIVRNDWPCPGCITQIPSSYNGSPTPVVIAFHGDEATATIMFGFMQQAAQNAGYILVAPKCPADQGCTTGSWWQWNGPFTWALSQLDAVAAQYAVDDRRVYALGGSGGAVYLGYRSAELPPRIAGFAMVSGGFSSITNTCESCLLPVYILEGDLDYLLSDAQLARDFFLGCGNEVVYDLLPGVDHQGAGEALRTGKGDAILSWFSARPNRCLP
jgi:predicted esterase